MLIGTRALQGLGAALISPAALSIISTTFAEGAERAKALGVWAAIAIGGSAVGLILGGVLTQSFSWPWIFFVNVPVGIVAFILSLRLVPESRDAQAQGSYDVAGAVTVTGGLMALVYAIVKAQTAGWTSATTFGFFTLAVLLLVSFVVIELRAAAPLVRLSIFRVRSLLTANLVMFLAMSGMFAMFFFNTLYIQRVLGYGPLKAGLAFLPFTAGIAGLGRAGGSVRAQGGRAAGRGAGDGGDRDEDAPTHEPARPRLLPGQRPAADPALVARHGGDLHALDADRDHGARGRGPGSGLGAVQHLAAGWRRPGSWRSCRRSQRAAPRRSAVPAPPPS